MGGLKIRGVRVIVLDAFSLESYVLVYYILLYTTTMYLYFIREDWEDYRVKKKISREKKREQLRAPTFFISITKKEKFTMESSHGINPKQTINLSTNTIYNNR